MYTPFYIAIPYDYSELGNLDLQSNFSIVYEKVKKKKRNISLISCIIGTYCTTCNAFGVKTLFHFFRKKTMKRALYI